MLTFSFCPDEGIPRSKSCISIGPEHDPRSYGKDGATTGMKGDTPRGAQFIDHPCFITLRFHDDSREIEMLATKSPCLLSVKITPEMPRTVTRSVKDQYPTCKTVLTATFQARPSHEADQGHVIEINSIGSHPTSSRGHLRTAWLSCCPCMKDDSSSCEAPDRS